MSCLRREASACEFLRRDLHSSLPHNVSVHSRIQQTKDQKMMRKNIRAKFLLIAVLGLTLLLANGNVLFTSRVARAQGIDVAGMDKSIDPGDDFFDYVNGGWSKAVQIPSDRPSFGAFDAIDEKVN